MDDLELEIWKACREADEKFEKDGAAGTKEWIREYFFPSLKKHGLEIRKAGEIVTQHAEISALTAQNKCPKCPCPHDWNTVKSHTEHFDGPTICTCCGKEES